MNRFRSGLVPLFALLALVGCNSEPTGDLRNGPEQLVATPSQLFIEVGETKTVEVGAVDAQGNPLDFNYEVTETGTGINVRRDSSFLPIFVNDSTLQAPAVGPRFRFIVEGTGYTQTDYTQLMSVVDVNVSGVLEPIADLPDFEVTASSLRSLALSYDVETFGQLVRWLMDLRLHPDETFTEVVQRLVADALTRRS